MYFLNASSWIAEHAALGAVITLQLTRQISGNTNLAKSRALEYSFKAMYIKEP